MVRSALGSGLGRRERKKSPLSPRPARGGVSKVVDMVRRRYDQSGTNGVGVGRPVLIDQLRRMLERSFVRRDSKASLG